MAAAGEETPAHDPLREEAFAWLARIRGHPDAETQAAFKDWYEADPRHAEVFESVLATWELNELSSRTPLARQPDRLGKYARRRRIRSCLAIAASLVLGLAVVTSIARTWMAGGHAPAERQEQLASGTAQIRTVTLPDGSRVTLDAASRLAVAFTASERRLTLERGRARFDVAHDPQHPFIVTAGAREVVAHGTLFDIDLRGSCLGVSLLRGSIEVRKARKPAAGHQPKPPEPGQYLLPGQRLVLETADGKAQPVAMPSDEPDWTTAMISFEDRPLSDVVAWANRDGSSRIVLAQPALASLRYSGTLRAGDTPGTAHMIAASFGLDMTRDKTGAILLARRN